MSRLRNKGFLLLEVMLAVTILSLGLALILRSFTTSLRAIKTSRNFLIANLLLEELIWQKEEEKAKGLGKAEEGKFSSPFDGFSYKASFEEQEEVPALYKSIFAVSWQEREKERSVSWVSYLGGE
ncbi:MAG: prepilin-type N-terminal cleavage/methylation domain-containing protein [Candidatus Omnitrophota bacterium]|nr:MAG: prepilin-type N-terminal cleavage/methylation domain-containing protein [Candidatus Omnitrophota bacterium]